MRTFKTIGIDITASHVHAVQLEHRAGRTLLQRAVSLPLPESDNDAVNVLASLGREHRFDTKSSTAVALENEKIYFANVDHLKAEELTQADQPNWQEEFPLPDSQIVTDGCSFHALPDSRQTFLIAATQREALNNRVDLFSSGNWNIRQVHSEIFAIQAAVAFSHPELFENRALIVYEGRTHLFIALVEDHNCVVIRKLTLPLPEENMAANLVRELEMTWRAATGQILPAGTSIVLSGSQDNQDDWKKLLSDRLLSKVIIHQPSEKIQLANGIEMDEEWGVALGLALGVRDVDEHGGPNFKYAHAAGCEADFNPRRHIYLTLGLVASVIVAFVIGQFVKRSSMERQNAAIESDIQLIYAQTFPEEKPPVKALAQINEHVARIKKALITSSNPMSFSIDPLDVLYHVVSQTPKTMDIELLELSIMDDTVQVKARCRNMEIAYEWKERLSALEGFKSTSIRSEQYDSQTNSEVFTLGIVLQ
jgi:hypothetical protein